MHDDGTDTGTTDIAPVAARPVVDVAAKNLEFTLFYTADLPKLVGFLVVQGARPDLAADLAQLAMTDAYRQWDTIEAPRAWVRTVATRHWWRHNDRHRHEVPLDSLPEPGSLLSRDEAADIEHRHTFLAVIGTLPPGQREVLAWTYDGYLPTEIAAQLGKTPEAVRSALRDARAVLRERYPRGEVTP
ncbi:sigma-70 family RNA polymerase sigma factor [Dactylosporangium maewongense]|uniref:Sigma-70 family RNA polymerase sigma factor n=1 Tax=Dactylosporangium maewongense TaxID=634393 RepID=A0ABP4MID7_9ACTN